MQRIKLQLRSPFIVLPGGGTVVAFCGRILALSRWNLQMSWCKCPGVPRGQPPGMAADKCITFSNSTAEFKLLSKITGNSGRKSLGSSIPNSFQTASVVYSGARAKRNDRFIVVLLFILLRSFRSFWSVNQ